MSSATTYYVTWIERSYQQTLEENVSSVKASNGMQTVVSRFDAYWPDDATKIDSARPILELAIKEMERHERELRDAAHTPAELELVDKLSILCRRLFVLTQAIPRTMDASSDFENDLSNANDQASEIIDQISVISKELRTINERLAAAAAKKRSIISNFVFLARLALLLTGPIVGVWLGWRLSTRLHKSVARIAVTLQQTGADQLNLGTVTLHSDGILGDVQKEAEKLVEKFQEAQRNVEEARTELVRSERLASVGQLAAGVAHEIRNPLTSVKLLLQHAAKTPDEKRIAADKMSLILEEIGRMEATIEGLLDFSRERPLRQLRHNLNAPLQRALNLVDGRARQNQVEVIASKLDEPFFVDGDVEQLHQVFVNLFLNAIEAMPNGGCLSVTTVSLANPPRVRVEVGDTGPGIPAEILSRVFEPFVTTKERGTGLGLAVSRRIIDQHGGSLIAKNSANGGAIFEIELPIVSEDVVDNHDRTDAVLSSSTTPDFSKTRSLKTSGGRTT